MEGEYYSHEHPLIPYEAQKVDGKSLDRCSACGKAIVGSAHHCSQPGCSFHLHKLCAQLPNKINYNLHPKHLLILNIKSPYHSGGFICNVCRRTWWDVSTYHCSKCSFDLCISCALQEELEHHSHGHILFLYEAEQKGGAQSPDRCRGCGNEILGSAYHCIRRYCSFQLHKICAQLPKETNHILHHHEKPLVLLKKPPYDPQTCECDACRQSWTNFTYHCSECDFNLCISCVLGKEREFQHKSHPHPLHLLQKPTMFQCDACNAKREETSYLCTECPFQIHTGCASLNEKPITIPDHDDELTLAFSLKDKYLPVCKICSSRIRPVDWVYCCDKCNYFAHVKCAISKLVALSLRNSQNMAKAKAEEDFYSSLFRLPALPDKYVDMISQFSKNKDRRATKIPNPNSGKDASVTETQNSNSGKGPSVTEAQNSNSGMAPSIIEAQKPNSDSSAMSRTATSPLMSSVLPYPTK
ncbi:hypothetical protein F0562_015709 [Nyssa sinensis]|uniref:Phorbol-ester/DAG-type domain-containing protein n=1 Tax=Nyssa sinensis TaxID=561372 RepID=A0A5J4ZI52_9ASTE|nr:hypothetical protein F0562_015709 [Nyssa sinensis]